MGTVLPHQFTLLYGARQLLTLRGPNRPRRGSELSEIGLIENGSILLKNGRIYQIGSTRRIENLAESKRATEVDCTGSVILPSFIDADITVLHPGKRSRWSAIYEDGLHLLRSCLHHGTTGAVVKARLGANTFEETAGMLRQFAKIGDNPVDLKRVFHIDVWPANDTQTASLAASLLLLGKRRLIDRVSIAAHLEWTAQAQAFADQLIAGGLALQTECPRRSTASSPANLSSMRPALATCPYPVDDFQALMLANAATIPVFGLGFATSEAYGQGLRQVIHAGGAPAISAGYDPVNSRGHSMQNAISMAVRHGMTVEQAVVASTVNAAHASGMGATVGTIEIGRRANMIALHVSDYRELPLHFGMNLVWRVFKDGNPVFAKPLRDRAEATFKEGEENNRVRAQHL